MREAESRFFDRESAEVRSEEEEGGRRVVRGVAMRYGSLSRPMKDAKGRIFRERFAPGAFSKAVGPGADIRLLVNHNRDLILARTKSKTLTVADGPESLGFTGYPVPSGIGEHYSLLTQRGDIDGVSFRFYKIRDEWSGTGDASVRTVLEADIDEISLVVFPAFSESTVTADTEAATRSLDQHLSALDTHGRRMRAMARRLRLAESL